LRKSDGPPRLPQSRMQMLGKPSTVDALAAKIRKVLEE
jgi:hypothetical protein